MFALILLIAGVLTALITASLLRQYGRAVQAMTRQRVADDDPPTPLSIRASSLTARPAPLPAWSDSATMPDARSQPTQWAPGLVGSGASPRLSTAARSILQRARWGPWLSALVYGV